MSESLIGKKMAVLVTDGIEQVELVGAKSALEKAWAAAAIASPKEDRVQGWNHPSPADLFSLDQSLTAARPEAFDALLLPGGVINPDALRIDAEAVAFVRAVVLAGKPVAAICHGPWTLIEVQGVQAKPLTSWPSLKSDLSHAGVTWVDEEVLVDGTLVTSRNPDDISAPDQQVVKLFATPG